MLRCWGLGLWISFGFLYSALSSEFDYTVQIQPGLTQCYFQPVTNPKHVAFEIDYQVIDGGDLDITFYIKNPLGAVLATDVRRQENTHRIEIRNHYGDYEICLDNSFSYQSEKTVFFEIFLEDKDGNVDDLVDFEKLGFNEAQQQEHVEMAIETMNNVRSSSVKLKTFLNRAEHYQALLRSVEAKDRAQMENNFGMVNFWSLINVGAMLIVSLIQVYMLRSLFEDNSSVGKIIRHGKL